MCTNNTNTLKCLIAERNKEKDRGRGKDEISCPQKFPDRLSKKKKTKKKKLCPTLENPAKLNRRSELKTTVGRE